MTIDHYIFEKVVCYERHELVPFSNNGSGGVTVSKIELTLADEETYEMPRLEEEINIITRVPLLFNHYPTPKTPQNEIKLAREYLKQMCKLGFPNIQRDFIDVFTKFMVSARALSYGALSELIRRSGSICNNGKYVKCHDIILIINRICIQLH